MTRGKFGRSVIAVSALALMAAPGWADVRYTTAMTFGDGSGGGQAGGPGMRTTTYVKDNNERVEMDMQMGPVQMKTVTLTLCGKKQTIQMDPALKIYTVKPMGAAALGAASAMAGAPGAKRPEGKTGTGKVVMTYTIQDLGREQVLNLDTRHVMVTIRTQSSGCAGTGDNTMKMEIWMAPMKVLNCPDRFAGSAGGETVADGADGCKITYEMKGDIDKMKDLYTGMVVQQKMYQGDKVTMTQTLREHSKAQLDANLFVVPADFNRLSEADFTKAQQKAMQDAMLRNMGQPPAGNEKVDAPERDDAAPAPAEEKKDEKPKKKRIKIPGLPF